MATAAALPPPASPAARAGGYGWYVAVLLAAAHLISFVDRFVMSLVMEPLKADLDVSDAQLGLLQGTGFVILYTVAAIPLGRMADRVHRRNLIVAGILAWSLATAACGLAASLGQLFVARIAVGLGEAALVPAAMSLLAAYFPRHQLGRAVSIFTTGASLGKSAALVGGGAVLAALTASGGLRFAGLAMAPWQGTFVAMAVPGLVLAALLLTVREPTRPVATAPRATLGDAWRHVADHRAAFLLHTLAAALVVMVVQSSAAWAPSFLVRAHGITPSQAGLAIGSVILFAGPLGHLAGGMLTDLFQRRGAAAPGAPVMIVGLLGTIPSVLLFTASAALPTALAGYGALSFFATLAAPASLAGLQMLVPDRVRGVVTSMFLAVTTMVGIGVGPAAVGAVSDILGGNLAAAIAITLSIVAALGAAAALASRGPFARTATTVSH